MSERPPAADREVDVRGLHCPQPLLAAKKALATMNAGQHLRVLATDANAAKDFRLFADASGNALVFSGGDAATTFVFVFRRRA
jgi:tRNA 2-thiouridine synthesizing protein A